MFGFFVPACLVRCPAQQGAGPRVADFRLIGRLGVWLTSLGIAAGITLAAGEPSLPAGGAPRQQAAAFTLSDQHNQTHRYDFPHPLVSVLVFADYDGSPQIEDWIQPIYARYQKRIAIHGVAELSKVPGFLKGMVRAFLRDRLQYPIMLDWQGSVSRNYHYEKGQANLFVVDTLGNIALKVLGAIDPYKLQQVVSQIDRLLSSPADAARQ